MRWSKAKVCIIAAFAAMSSVTVFGDSITLSDGETRVVTDSNVYVVPENATVTLSGNLGRGGRIALENNATVKLNGLKALYSDGYHAIYSRGNGTIILVDGSENKVEGGYKSESLWNTTTANPPVQYTRYIVYSAISVAEGNTLTIKGETNGTGKLSAVGGSFDLYHAAGIGSSAWNDATSALLTCGNIVIEGGIITTGTGEYDCGVGSGSSKSRCGNITIKDTITKVEARTIGRGSSYDWNKSYCGTITIGSHLKQETINGVQTITPKTYTIVFNANGGDNNISKTLRYGIALGTLPVPTRAGYTFAGWYTAVSGGSLVSTATTVTADVTYYAHWTANSYTIAYDANDGSGETVSTAAIYDQDVTLATNGFTYYAKQFAGWATEADGEGIYNAGQTVSNLTTEAAGIVTLYAVWEPLVVPLTEIWGADGAEFCGDSYTVTLSCPLDGAAIYYTTNGVTPRTSAAFAYTDPIVVYGSVNIVAIAVKDGVRSEYTRVSILQITPDTPIITPADGTEFRSESCEVLISCATDGAEIYYTLDGSTPHKESGIRYTVPFTISDTTTVKAMAVGGPLQSEVVTATIVKRSLSLAEATGAIELPFETDDDVPWHPIVDASSENGFAAQSGSIGMNTSTWMETTVRGSGTFSFKWRVECEKDDSGRATWDRLMVFTNGTEAVRIDGITEWQSVTFVFGDHGEHTIRWEYLKDDYDDDIIAFADSAWVSGVSWTADDPLPALDVAATDGDVAAIIAGLSDVRLSEKVIGTTAYGAFRTWVDSKNLSHAAVRDASNAWLSYALDAPALMSKELTSDDVHIVSLDVEDGGALGTTRPTSFTLEVAIDGVNIGEGARLAEVLSVEGATELDESAFSTDGLSFTLQRTADGKAKAIVTPVGSPPSFFLRMSVK